MCIRDRGEFETDNLSNLIELTARNIKLIYKFSGLLDFSLVNNIKSLKYLKGFIIDEALPVMNNFYNYNSCSFMEYSTKIFFSGDFLASPSLNGAIESGENLAKGIF